ncbi:MAG: hypothetical protein ABFD92_03785 [Planctomycetaceae bacterium]|nr:hypothetical protein [Planctomycetaceae bacterium]
MRWIIIAAVVLFLIFLASGGHRPEPEVNTELALAARSAVEMAQTAQEHNDSAYLSPGRYRMLALSMGASIPLAAVAVMTWLATRRYPDDLGLLHVMERLEVKEQVEQVEMPEKVLSTSSQGQLPMQEVTEGVLLQMSKRVRWLWKKLTKPTKGH